MAEFRNSEKFSALMVSLGRIENVNQTAFEAAQASERQPQDINDRRRLELENKLLARQLRSALLCSAYSMAEAAIIGLTPEGSAPTADVRRKYELTNDGRISPLYRSQYILQHVADLCKTTEWDRDWASLHRLRGLRNKIIHEGGLDQESKLTAAIDRDDGFGAWIEPFFDGSEVTISVLVVGEMHFRQWLQRLQRMIFDIDAELSKLIIK